jgi:hypothetical protein
VVRQNSIRIQSRVTHRYDHRICGRAPGQKCIGLKQTSFEEIGCSPVGLRQHTRTQIPSADLGFDEVRNFRRPDRNGGAGHQAGRVISRGRSRSCELCARESPYSGQDAFGPHGSSGHSQRGAASGGAP